MAFEQQPPSTRHRGVLFGVAVAAVVLLTAAQNSCQNRAETSDGGGGSAPNASSGTRVTYDVTADGQIASVSYTNSDGDIDTDIEVGNGWTGSARMPNTVTNVELSAVAGSGTSVLRCTIRVDGKVVQEAKAAGSSAKKVHCAASVTASDG